MDRQTTGIEIGRRIAEFRKARGMRKIDVATELDYSTANYGKIEKGEVCLDCQGLTALCRLFHCQPEQIVYGTSTYIPDIEIYFSSRSEQEKRRILRLLYLACHCDSGDYPDAFHHLFGSCILDNFQNKNESHLTILLEFERKIRNLTKRNMAQYLQISKNKYYSILNTGELSDIISLIHVNEILGYHMSFLLWDEVSASYFFSSLEDKENWASILLNMSRQPSRFSNAASKPNDLSFQFKKYANLLLEFQGQFPNNRRDIRN